MAKPLRQMIPACTPPRPPAAHEIADVLTMTHDQRNGGSRNPDLTSLSFRNVALYMVEAIDRGNEPEFNRAWKELLDQHAAAGHRIKTR